MTTKNNSGTDIKKNKVACTATYIENKGDWHECRCYRYKDHPNQHACALALCGRKWSDM